MAALLWRRVLDEINPLLDVPLQPLDTSFDQFLLFVVCVSEDIESFLGTRGL